jgi:lipopolysaccharide/colanic/teichoic acid biosynthesis glycosyltransferase
MDGVVASSRTVEAEAFLLSSESCADSAPALLPDRLFPRSRERLRIGVYALLLATDLALIAGAFLAAGTIRLGSPLEQQSIRTLVVMLPTFFAIALHNGAYSIKSLQRPAWGAVKLVEALAYATAVAIALLFYMKASIQFSREIFAIGSALAVLVAVPGRFAAASFVQRKFGRTFVNRLVILDGVESLAVPDALVVSARELRIGPDESDPILLDRLGRALEGCDAVVVACAPSRRAKWSHALRAAAVDVEIVAPELDQFHPIGLGEFNGRRTLLVSTRPLNVRDRALKRVLDLVVAGVGLVILSPVMVAVGAAILIESGGPVLFRQRRVGRNNCLFDLLKFRSFSADCNDVHGVRSASPGDERMTRVGRFIRRTSLDELPQLVNVLAGHMSIVGPRPHALGSTAEDAPFWKIDARYFHRHVVKPGMTGLAQIRGYRGATRRQGDLTNRLQSDLEYLREWTIWRDLRIIIVTFGVMLHPNAF